MKPSTIVGFALIVAAVLIFYLAFFKLAPYVASTLPDNSWHDFLSIMTYAGIAYIGGIGLPLALIMMSCYIMLTD